MRRKVIEGVIPAIAFLYLLRAEYLFGFGEISAEKFGLIAFSIGTVSAFLAFAIVIGQWIWKRLKDHWEGAGTAANDTEGDCART